MGTMLATHGDAVLILKLYELRMEPGLRAARQWVTAKFWPQSAQDVLNVQNAFGTKENEYLRQVVSYWEMASALVLHGALDGDLFLDCNGENFFLLAKFLPFLQELRATVPHFLKHTEELTSRYSSARERLEGIVKTQQAIRAKLPQA